MYTWEGDPEATYQVSQRDPRQYPWGFCIEAMNGRLLKWFISPRELLDFIILEESEICAEPGEEIIDIKNNLQSVLGASKTLDSTLLNEANNILSNFNETRIVWWGNFPKLCQGEEEYSREIIESFAGYCSLKIKTITPEYEQKFVEYIHEWGG